MRSGAKRIALAKDRLSCLSRQIILRPKVNLAESCFQRSPAEITELGGQSLSRRETEPDYVQAEYESSYAGQNDESVEVLILKSQMLPGGTLHC
jgi:hypothetical protein